MSVNQLRTKVVADPTVTTPPSPTPNPPPESRITTSPAWPTSVAEVLGGLTQRELLHDKRIRRAHILPAPTALGIWWRCRTLVSSALKAIGVDHFAVPGFDPLVPVIAVPLDKRERAIAMLTALCRETYGELSVPAPSYVADESASASPSWPRRSNMSDIRILRLSWLWADPSGQLVYGSQYGCDIEFWEPTRDGRLAGPRHNRVVPLVQADSPAVRVPAAQFTALAQGEHLQLPALSSRREFSHVLPEQVTFPIDLVYTWVDGADEAWRGRRAAGAVGGYHREAASPARYLNRNELRYSLRSIHCHAPWVRNVYIVTDNQAPQWLNRDHPRMQVVDHRDIFSRPTDLPSFNSHAIESQLHHIDGLSEHFLYLNDDMFLGRPVEPGMFFESNGLSRFFPAETRVDMAPVSELDSPPDAAAKNNRRLLAGSFGRSVSRMFQHVPYALRRSVMADIEREYDTAHRATAGHPFRDLGDVSIPSSLHHNYAYLTGRAVRGSLRHVYLQLDMPDLATRLDRLLDSRDVDAFCLNDSRSTGEDVDLQEAMLRAFLEAYFPVRSEFELD